MDEKNPTANKPRKSSQQPRPRRPMKSGQQGKGPEWTGEGDSSIERGQRGGETSKEGGSQWPKSGE